MKMNKIIVYGGKGWIGKQFLSILNHSGKDYVSLNTRIENVDDVVKDIKNINQLILFLLQEELMDLLKVKSIQQ